jgi:hypothetical protein
MEPRQAWIEYRAKAWHRLANATEDGHVVVVGTVVVFSPLEAYVCPTLARSANPDSSYSL